ncbi:MAG TPA: bifunctional DNA-formamidopyrimidine glycosylase/DNA-(apurinic or apyrimidinic site) lyase [Gemmatimonadaceae bacterium]|nr:bifunctional DNA-formamidopyrimidine glycosylase/DNA-(apurinic or apyrimidinic site) lyase [Gemmatimonadaceae bacterium]
MPELPETETLARDLGRSLVGRRITGVTVVRRDVLRGVTALRLSRRVTGAEITGTSRRAKFVLLHLSTGDRLVFQPRFTGGVVVSAGDEPITDAFVTIEMELADGGRFAFRDVRRLGTVELLDSAGQARLEARLGVEPLDSAFTAARLSEFLRSSRQAIKKILMDQSRVAGVGNIYANEALWLAGIDPSKPGKRVSAGDVVKLRDAVVKVLSDAVVARGTTFRDFRDAYGTQGGFAPRLAAYGREGRPCLRCGSRLVGTHAIDGRATVFCFRCQR